MITNSEIREMGRLSLSGRWLEAAMLTLVFVIVNGMLSSMFNWPKSLAISYGCSSLISLLLLPMSWGYSMSYLANHRRENSDPFDLPCLADGYRNGNFRRVLWTYLLMYVYFILWCMLLIIPGIVKAFSYAMAPYILRDRPDLSGDAAIEMSMAMMSGHKADLFFLYLSFIGWAVLAVLTLGIGFFWLVPYMNASIAAFYDELKRDFENYHTQE